MKRSEIIAWLLVGFLYGLVIGMWLANRNRQQPPPEPPCADEKPTPDDAAKDGVDIALVPDDFKREGRGA